SSPSSTIPGSSAQYHLCSPLGKSPVTTKNSSLYLLTSTVAPTLIRKLLPSLGAVSNVFHSGRAEAYANLIKSSMLHFSISARTNPLACAHHSLKSVIFHPPYIIRYSSVPFQCLPLGISSKLFILTCSAAASSAASHAVAAMLRIAPRIISSSAPSARMKTSSASHHSSKFFIFIPL